MITNPAAITPDHNGIMPFDPAALAYLNEYPAFSTDRDHYINNDFWINCNLRGIFDNKHVAKRYPAGISRYHDNIRIMNWGWDMCRTDSYFPEYKTFDMNDAYDLIECIDPLWCKWKGIETTGYCSKYREELTFSEDLDI